MSTLDAFLPFVRVHVSGLPAPVLLHEIRSAAIRFCERSRAWKGVTQADVVADQASYTVPVPAGAVLGVLEEVYLNGQWLRPKPLDELRTRWTHWTTISGNPMFYTQLEPGVLTLVPYPTDDRENGLEMRAFYKPSYGAEELPDFLLEHYAQIIASGALAALMRMPDMPCYNPNQAETHQVAFDMGAAKAHTQADRSFTRAPRRVIGRFM